MRTTYREQTFQFTNPELQGWPQLPPDRIIVHRQGNPGASAADALAWGDRVGAFSIHTYIDDDLMIHCVPLDRQAFHANARSAEQARLWGYPYLTPGGERRGDIRAVGIETCDDEDPDTGLPRLTQQTRITLVLALARLCSELGLDPLKGHTIDEHAAYGDPTRAQDLGDTLYIPDLRLDVADQLAGREPWRTVRESAYGRPAPESWRPSPPTPTTPPPRDTTLLAHLTVIRDHAQAALNEVTR